ncbi:MAG: SDR family oxidoreductase [Pseudomonadota bacterium]
MGRVAGKKAFITGAAQGLGAEFARTLAREGAKVALTDINFHGAEAVAAEINEAEGAGTAFAFKHDVVSEADWDAALKAANEAMGGVSVLVNNAGVGGFGSIEDETLEGWRRVMEIDVDSLFIGTKAAMPYLKANQPGSIVNISSIAGILASGVMLSYNVAKAGVLMFSKSVALHCAAQGYAIRSNSVHPVFIDTPILDPIKAMMGGEEEGIAKLSRQIPMKRVGEPSDVANVVLYLASDESKFVTGSEFKVDGGISAQ